MIKVYQNKRNANKFIEVKRTNDRHYMWRQFMSWEETGVKNYTGSKSFKRMRKGCIDEVLEDYIETA